MSICQHEILESKEMSISFWFISAAAMTVFAAEFSFAATVAPDQFGAAVRADVVSLLNRLKIFKTFHPFLAAPEAFHWTDVSGKITAFNMDSLSVNQAVCNFFRAVTKMR